MKIYNFIYYVLVGVIFLILFKFGFDFYYLSKSTVEIQSKTDVEYNRFIIKPRLQVNDDKFEYIKATRGFMDQDSSYVFENVDSDGFYGNINAGKLVIKDEENILEFTINPQFNIYIDSL